MPGLFQPIMVVSVAKGVSQANNLHYSINLPILHVIAGAHNEKEGKGKGKGARSAHAVD